VLPPVLALDSARVGLGIIRGMGSRGATMSTLREPQFEEKALTEQEFEELLLKTWEYMGSEENDVRLADSAPEPPSLP
jgi:hypothetical protein